MSLGHIPQHSLPEALGSSGRTFHVSRNTDSSSDLEMFKSGYKHNTITQITQIRPVLGTYQKIIVRILELLSQLNSMGILTEK